MPRLQPPPGFTTAGRAAAKLGISEALLSRYVKDGKIKRYGPEERKHKFYKISEIDALLETERMFPDEAYKRGDYKKNPISTFERATDLDMPAIIDISHAIFGDSVIPAEIRLSWLHRNPETFYVVKDASGTVKSYASWLPLARATIEKVIRDELDVEAIPPDEIEVFAPGGKFHLYVMAIGTDPRIEHKRERYEYSARMINGMFNVFFDLAQRGIEIETLTARSHKPDGLRLLRKIGIPQLHSPVPGKALFALRVSESGFYIFERYTELLTEWQIRQKAPTLPSSPYSMPAMAPESANTPPAPASPTHPPPMPRPPHKARSGERIDYIEANRPPGALTIHEFAVQLGINRTTLLGHLKHWEEEGGTYTKIAHPSRDGETLRYFTTEEQAAFNQWRAHR